MTAILVTMLICGAVAISMLSAAVVSVNEADAVRVRQTPRPY
jgi:hypothetical protein